MWVYGMRKWDKNEIKKKCIKKKNKESGGAIKGYKIIVNQGIEHRLKSEQLKSPLIMTLVDTMCVAISQPLYHPKFRNNNQKTIDCQIFSINTKSEDKRKA